MNENLHFANVATYLPTVMLHLVLAIHEIGICGMYFLKAGLLDDFNSSLSFFSQIRKKTRTIKLIGQSHERVY